MSELGSNKRLHLSTRAIAYWGLAWVVCLLALLSWQSHAYTGVVAALAEWQFARFGKFFPVATIALLTLLLALPFLIPIGLRVRPPGRKQEPLSLAGALQRAVNIGNFLAVCALVSGVAALIVGIVALTTGRVSDKPPYTLSLAGNVAPQEGATKASGLVLLNRVGYYRESILVVGGRQLYIAPLVSKPDDRVLRYFVEVPQQNATAAERRNMSGILRRSALPGALEQLYRDAGYEIARPSYVLFASSASARWAFLSGAADLAVLTLLLALGYLLQRRHVARLERSAGKRA